MKTIKTVALLAMTFLSFSQQKNKTRQVSFSNKDKTITVSSIPENTKLRLINLG